jgi:hypothetical protein
MLESNAAADGSIDPTKIDRFVTTAAGILGDDGDPRRRALIQLVMRRAVLADGHLSRPGSRRTASNHPGRPTAMLETERDREISDHCLPCGIGAWCTARFDETLPCDVTL